MLDEMYKGTVTGIPPKKHAALDFAESMIPNFEEARASERPGKMLNLSFYMGYFNDLKMLTREGRQWQVNQVSALWNADRRARDHRKGGVERFDEQVAVYMASNYPAEQRKLKASDWAKLRAWYIDELDKFVVRARPIALMIRGETAPTKDIEISLLI